MRTVHGWRGLRQLLAALALMVLGAAAWADPPGRVGRLAQASGTVWIYDAEQGEWTAVGVNRPITTGDRLATDNGARADVQIGSASLRLGSGTEIVADQLDDQRVLLRLERGSAALRLRAPDSVDEFELTANDARYIPTRAGQYRLDLQDNVASAQVWSGEMRFQASDSTLLLQPGTRYSFWRQDDRTHYDMAAAAREDDFGAWVLAQDRLEERAAASRYVSPEMTGAQDLDRYGRWDTHPEYGAVWFPVSVAASWAPYRYGRWAWVAPWGWSWVDDAPWGFAPFHYGRWASWRGRWCWVPGRYVPRPVYAPALVGWIGGNNISVGVTVGNRRAPPPVIGWVPLAPRDPFVPRFNASPRYIRNVNAGHASWQPPQGSPPPWANRNIPGAVTVVPADTLHNRARVADRVLPHSEPRWTAALPTQQPQLPPRPDRPDRRDGVGRADRPDHPGGRGDGPGASQALVPPPPSIARPAVPQQPPGVARHQPWDHGQQPGGDRPRQPGGAIGQPPQVVDVDPSRPGIQRPAPGVVTTLPGAGSPQDQGTVSTRPNEQRQLPPGSPTQPHQWPEGPRSPQAVDADPSRPGIQRAPPGVVTTLPGAGTPQDQGTVSTRPDGQRQLPPGSSTRPHPWPEGPQPGQQPPGAISTQPGVVPGRPQGGVIAQPPGAGAAPPQGVVQMPPGNVPGRFGERDGVREGGRERPPSPPLQRSGGYQAGDVPGAPPRVGREHVQPEQRDPGALRGFDNARPAMPTIPGNRVPPEPPRAPQAVMPVVPQAPAAPPQVAMPQRQAMPQRPEAPAAPQRMERMQPPAQMAPPAVQAPPVQAAPGGGGGGGQQQGQGGGRQWGGGHGRGGDGPGQGQGQGGDGGGRFGGGGPRER